MLEKEYFVYVPSLSLSFFLSLHWLYKPKPSPVFLRIKHLLLSRQSLSNQFPFIYSFLFKTRARKNISSSSPFQPHPNFLLDSTIFLPSTPLTPSNNKNISVDSSSIVTDSILKSAPSLDKKRKLCNEACSNDFTHSMKEMGGKREKKMKEEQKGGGGEEAATGYIHVRARRGQATDSHSLAERVRRERISERMKLLQALVPGCDKVNGKALMLDEIINYVQSLQHQVELLSMKLASVNPMSYDFGMDIEPFMVQPDLDLNNYSPPLPSLQECLPSMETQTYDLPESFALIPAILPEVYTNHYQQDIMGSG